MHLLQEALAALVLLGRLMMLAAAGVAQRFQQQLVEMAPMAPIAIIMVELEALVQEMAVLELPQIITLFRKQVFFPVVVVVVEVKTVAHLRLAPMGKH